MSITPTPSIPRGAEPSLQAFYYHSSLFITALREDIDLLLTTYAHAYAREAFEPEKPFELFKTVWKSSGWNYAHLVCVDAKRPTFVSSVGRCFVERVADTSENLLRRAAALFGLYIWYMTQPKNIEANIPVAEYITVPIDIYEVILNMHTSYDSPLRTYITFVVSQLLSQSLFHIIPSTKYHPQNPRELPHNMPLLTRDIEAGHSTGGWKKRGRPSQIDQAQRAEKVLSELETFLNDKGAEPGSENAILHPQAADLPSAESYLALKQQLKESVPPDVLRTAEETTLGRVEAAEEHIKRKYLNTQDVHYEGLERLREQIRQDGLLNLFRG